MISPKYICNNSVKTKITFRKILAVQSLVNLTLAHGLGVIFEMAKYLQDMRVMIQTLRNTVGQEQYSQPFIFFTTYEWGQ